MSRAQFDADILDTKRRLDVCWKECKCAIGHTVVAQAPNLVSIDIHSAYICVLLQYDTPSTYDPARRTMFKKRALCANTLQANVLGSRA